jgi:hypothetical protein
MQSARKSRVLQKTREDVHKPYRVRDRAVHPACYLEPHHCSKGLQCGLSYRGAQGGEQSTRVLCCYGVAFAKANAHNLLIV